jgi:hypothetical protein
MASFTDMETQQDRVEKFYAFKGVCDVQYLNVVYVDIGTLTPGDSIPLWYSLNFELLHFVCVILLSCL